MPRRLPILLVAVPLAVLAGVVIGRAVAPAKMPADPTVAPPPILPDRSR